MAAFGFTIAGAFDFADAFADYQQLLLSQSLLFDVVGDGVGRGG